MVQELSFSCDCGLDWMTHRIALGTIDAPSGKIGFIEFRIITNDMRLSQKIKLAIAILCGRRPHWHGLMMGYETALYYKSALDEIMNRWNEEIREDEIRKGRKFFDSNSRRHVYLYSHKEF